MSATIFEIIYLEGALKHTLGWTKMNRILTTFANAAIALPLMAAMLMSAPRDVRADELPVSLIQLRAYIVAPVGLEQGKFKENNVALDLKIFNDNLLINEAMTGGAADVAINGANYNSLSTPDLPYSIIAIAEQSPEAVGIIAAADSDIETLADLKGKTIGGTDGTAPIAYVQEALADIGITKEDYKYVKIEPSSGAAALASKQIDAWIIYNPFIASAVSNGLAKIIFTPTEKYFNNFVIIMAPKKAIAGKPEALAAFLRGYKASLEWVQSNKEAAVAAYAKATGLAPDVAELTFAKRNQKFMAPDAAVIEDFSREAKVYLKYGLAKGEPDWANVATTEIWDLAFGKK
jgi:sulfonate transport system substrate-binding protein